MLVKDKARLDAREVLGETWAAGFPVDPERIASQLGIVVRRIPLEDGVSGMLQAEPGFDPEIFVNSNDTRQRQQFTIAHELGHYYERAKSGETDFNYIDYRGTTYDLHEFYADEFAGALLMPITELDRLKGAGSNIADLARHFGVSIAAVQKRLERLEL